MNIFTIILTSALTFSFLVIVFLILKLLKKDKSDQINYKIKDDIESLKVSLNSQISGITGSFNNLSTQY